MRQCVPLPQTASGIYDTNTLHNERCDLSTSCAVAIVGAYCSFADLALSLALSFVLNLNERVQPFVKEQINNQLLRYGM